MKILLTGGGTGGHFYPLMAVARALNAVADQEKIAKLVLIYMAESPYDKNLLLQNGIKFKKTYSGKIRRYFSFLNVLDMFKIIPGVIRSVFGMYFDFPDAVFSKGGSDSFPAVLAARILGIPIMIHESDTVPGKANLWTGRFAKRIAIAFTETADYFPKNKTALVGNPIRQEFFVKNTLGAREYFNIKNDVPVVFVFGGSQGAKNINDNLLDILPELVSVCQIIHQCGERNYKETKERAELVLEKSAFKNRYHLHAYLEFDAMRMAYGSSDLVVSRAGSGSIFEIAASGLPSIVIPLTEAAQNHQRENAYAYAKSGAAVVIEERNLKPHLLKSEIERVLAAQELLKQMSEAAKRFSKIGAAEKIARELIRLAIEHK